MEETLNRLKELIAQREAIDKELTEMLGGAVPKAKRTSKCGTCGQEGHSSRTCPQKPQE